MSFGDKSADKVKVAVSNGVLNRLPLTFLPFVNQQVHQWEYLFPNERQSVERLLLFVTSLTPEQSSQLFSEVVQLEEKMGVRNWQFSTTEQTILNSSQLARSPYFQDWRRAVQTVFDAADAYALRIDTSGATEVNRLVLLNIPQLLPLDGATVWSRWKGIGRTVKLNLTRPGDNRNTLGFLLNGDPVGSSAAPGGVLSVLKTRPQNADADMWVVDAGRALVDGLMSHESPVASAKPILLSYGRLNQYQESFSHEMNTMRKDLADADAVFDRLRKVDVTPWCPPEVASDAAVREFLRSLYLTGNGAVIFGNSFVEWASSEAFRRARPAFLAAQFGTRTKPKPFTGVAVFENPDQVNPLPAVDDLPGSAVDAQILALYVWLAANRYEEYRKSSICICIAESLSEAYIVAPPEFDLLHDQEPVSLDRLSHALRAWMT